MSFSPPPGLPSSLDALVLLHLVLLTSAVAAGGGGPGAPAQGQPQGPLQGLQAGCADVGADLQAGLAALELLQLAVGLGRGA